MEWQELAATAGRSLAVYALMLTVIRLLGKRTVGNFTAFDLLVALMLGEIVDEAIYGDVSFPQATVAIVVIAAAKYATSWLTYSSKTLSLILEGKPREIISHGQTVPAALRAELMNELEAYAALRLQGIDDIREVRSAQMEVDGQVSVMKEEWAKPLQKSDVGKGEGDAPESEPSDEQSMISKRALGEER